MANPIIDSITVSPDPVPTGQTGTITIVAHDADAKTVTFTAVVTDSVGNQTPGSGSFTTSDPLTYAVTVDSGTVVPGVQPNVFTWSE